MSDNKKYYYMKVKEDFFRQKEVHYLETIPKREYIYSNILLKMYFESLSDNGRLIVREGVPYEAKTLAHKIGHTTQKVKEALELFQKLKLIEILDDGTIYMLNIQDYIGSSTTEADRKAAYRRRIEEEKKRLSQKSNESMSDNGGDERDASDSGCAGQELMCNVEGIEDYESGAMDEKGLDRKDIEGAICDYPEDFQEAFVAWVDMRREERAPLRRMKSVTGALDVLDKYTKDIKDAEEKNRKQIEILNASTRNSWKKLCRPMDDWRMNGFK